LRADLHFYATVPMPDAGPGAPIPTDRRSSNDDVVACYVNLEHWAQEADRAGFDTLWLTEHHFQDEGYEVTPNLILFGVHLAGITRRLRFGQMFNIVPQWHPLRLAEDFAMADILTGGRLVFEVGRGTVPRGGDPRRHGRQRRRRRRRSSMRLARAIPGSSLSARPPTSGGYGTASARRRQPAVASSARVRGGPCS